MKEFTPSRRKTISLVFLGTLLSLLGSLTVVDAQLQPGEIIVVDFSAGTGNDGVLFRIDPETGIRSILTEFGSAGFERGTWVASLALELAGTVLVPGAASGLSRGLLFRVDPALPPTGNRSIVSDFSDPTQGPLGSNTFFGIAIDNLGNPLVVDGLPGSAAVFKVNPNSGSRTLLTDFGNPSQGPLGNAPFGITIDSKENILVVDRLNRGENTGLLFAVNATSGERTIVSDFSNSAMGPLGREPIGVATDALGNIFVTDREAGTNNRGLLFKIDSLSGTRVIVTDFSDASQGPLGCDPTGIWMTPAGKILVADSGGSAECGVIDPPPLGVLFEIEPTTGNRFIISDFSNSSEGPIGSNPTGVAVVSIVTPREVVIDIMPDRFPSNPNSKGMISVTILTTDTFDATTIDPLTVGFGPNGATEAHGRGHLEDANRDGHIDLVLHFNAEETGVQCGDTSVSLTGKTFSGDSIVGRDSIATVKCK